MKSKREERCVQKPCAVDYAQDNDRGAGNAEDGSIWSMEKMTIGGAENFVFGNERAPFREAFQRSNLLFEGQYEGRGIIWVVLGNIVPQLRNVGFGGWSDFNLEFYGHA